MSAAEDRIKRADMIGRLNLLLDGEQPVLCIDVLTHVLAMVIIAWADDPGEAAGAVDIVANALPRSIGLNWETVKSALASASAPGTDTLQ